MGISAICGTHFSCLCFSLILSTLQNPKSHIEYCILNSHIVFFWFTVGYGYGYCYRYCYYLTDRHNDHIHFIFHLFLMDFSENMCTTTPHTRTHTQTHSTLKLIIPIFSSVLYENREKKNVFL